MKNESMIEWKYSGVVPMRVQVLHIWLIGATDVVPDITDMPPIERYYALMLANFTIQTNLAGGTIKAESDDHA